MINDVDYAIRGDDISRGHESDPEVDLLHTCGRLPSCDDNLVAFQCLQILGRFQCGRENVSIHSVVQQTIVGFKDFQLGACQLCDCIVCWRKDCDQIRRVIEFVSQALIQAISCEVRQRWMGGKLLHDSDGRRWCKLGNAGAEDRKKQDQRDEHRDHRRDLGREAESLRESCEL
jgi:hypothetical protein